MHLHGTLTSEGCPRDRLHSLVWLITPHSSPSPEMCRGLPSAHTEHGFLSLKSSSNWVRGSGQLPPGLSSVPAVSGQAGLCEEVSLPSPSCCPFLPAVLHPPQRFALCLAGSFTSFCCILGTPCCWLPPFCVLFQLCSAVRITHKCFCSCILGK